MAAVKRHRRVRLFIYSDETDTEADEILLFRYVYDLSSNVAAILDENGEIVRVDPEGRTSSESNFVPSAAAAMCLFEYDAFGNNLYRATPNQPNSETAMHIAWNEIFPHHLAGKEWDTEARLYYFGYRWYEPHQGAFISRCPLGPLVEETYAYCHNDPVNFIDPDGMRVYGQGGSISSTSLFGGQFQVLAVVDEKGCIGMLISVNLGAGLDAGLSAGKFRSNADRIWQLDSPNGVYFVDGNFQPPMWPVGVNTSFTTNLGRRKPGEKMIYTSYVGAGVGPMGGALGLSYSKSISTRVPYLTPILDFLIPDDDRIKPAIEVMNIFLTK